MNVDKRLRLGIVSGAVAGWAAIMIVACGGSGDVQTITETRTVSSPASTPGAGMSTAARMGVQTAAPASAQYSWETPEGWQEQPSTSTRLANFTIGDGIECYLTVLPGGGGGVEANVNRWRGQMSLEPYTPEEMADLKTKRVLEKDALYVEFEGTYVGMGNSEHKEGQKMLGVIFDDAGSSVFVKMVGPTETVNAEKERFDAFCASLKASSGTQIAGNLPEGHPDIGSFSMPNEPQLPAGHPEIGGQMQSPGQLPAGHPEIGGAGAPPSTTLAWTAPDTWKQGPDKPMRAVTFTMGESGQSECYISELSGAAGGIEMNINRWRNQMGQEALDAAAIEALPKVAVLGQSVPLVEIPGNFTGMDGQLREGYVLYGVVCPVEGQTIFVKLTGPESEAAGERDRFAAFCESLKLQ